MFEGLLIHRAYVQSRNALADRFGQPSSVFADSGGPYPCRLTIGSGGKTMGERSRDVEEVTHQIFLTADVDVHEDNLIRVEDASGTEILQPAQILLRKPVYDGVGLHHLELTVWVQRGPE